MTDQQIIETLATKVMGWEIRTVPDYAIGGTTQVFYLDGKSVTENNYVVTPYSWNPLTDWNHTMQVVHHVCRKLRKEDEFVSALQKRVMPGGSYITTDWSLMVLGASQMDLCLSAIDSLKSHS